MFKKASKIYLNYLNNINKDGGQINFRDLADDGDKDNNLLALDAKIPSGITLDIIFDALPAEALIINRQGEIIFASKLWMKHQSELIKRSFCLDEESNYFSLLSCFYGSDEIDRTEEIKKEIKRVLNEENDHYRFSSPAYSGGNKSRGMIDVSSLPGGALIFHIRWEQLRENEIAMELNEIKLLYELTGLFLDSRDSIIKMMKKSADLIQKKWAPLCEIYVRMSYKGKAATSSIFEKTKWRTVKKLGKEDEGYLEVYYQAEDDTELPPTFLERDDRMLDKLSDRLSALIFHRSDQENLEYVSYQDSLTSLYNRRFFQEELERLDTERQLPLTIIMVDVNSLKLVNDGFGHDKGDDLLKRTAEILQMSVRSEDIVSRWGGDEFAILLPQTGGREAEKVIARIQDYCKKSRKKDIPVTLGIGHATKNKMSQDVESILQQADTRMYMDKQRKSRSSEDLMIMALLEHLKNKSEESQRHMIRMTDFLYRLGNRLEISEVELEELYQLAQLHDIGSVYISEEILKRKGSLSEEEWKLIKRHPEKGFRLTLDTDKFSHLADKIFSHHERWDGSGYPRGLKKEEIPRTSRIFAVVDAYEVMTGGRGYQKAVDSKEALNELARGAGSQFDPEVVKAFTLMIENGGISEEF